jgi:hypothetical protein
MGTEKPLLLRHAEDFEYYARQLLDADIFMKRVHFADHLQTTWFAMRQEIEHILKTGKPELVQEKPVTKRVGPQRRTKPPALNAPHEDHPKDEPKLRFRDKTVADGAAILLAEQGKLHGREIERLLKEGGYRSKSQFFQNVLDSTFKRDGRFRNVGGNTWELKEPSLFTNGKVEVGKDAAELPNPQ